MHDDLGTLWPPRSFLILKRVAEGMVLVAIDPPKSVVGLNGDVPSHAPEELAINNNNNNNGRQDGQDGRMDRMNDLGASKPTKTKKESKTTKQL